MQRASVQGRRTTMTKYITQAMLSQLQDVFCITDRSRAQCSAADTNQGTEAIWKKLEKAKLVKRRPTSPLGHRFSFEITNDGKDAIANGGAS